MKEDLNVQFERAHYVREKTTTTTYPSEVIKY